MLLGQGDGQATADAWTAVAPTHAALALAAATAVGASGADHRAWADAAGPGSDPAAVIIDAQQLGIRPSRPPA
jgi:hypothetical protein